MKQHILRRTVLSCVVIFLILIAVHGFEAIVIRTDRTAVGENFINKLFGIAVMAAVLGILGKKPADIGFGSKRLARDIGIGAVLASGVFAAAYTAEMLILRSRGESPALRVFTSGFSLTGAAAIHTGAGFILMCVFFNIINVVMEEGTFRGLFAYIVGTDRSARFALLFQALLFGVWHIVTPIAGLAGGEMSAAECAVMSAGYIILAGLMGIKWGMLYKLTGSLYAGMTDHFINNCAATNLLHVVTAGGVDDMMTVRVLIAQLLSFAIVAAVYFRARRAERGPGN